MADITATIGLSPSTISTVEQLLRRGLANTIVLQSKLKQFHRNVRGPHFTELHTLFGKLAEELDPIIDDTAERIRALGKEAPGTMKTFLEEATLLEHTATDTDATHMLTILLSDYEHQIQETRTDIRTCADAGDDGNADFLTGLLEQYEKTAWMLRATLS